MFILGEPHSGCRNKYRLTVFRFVVVVDSRTAKMFITEINVVTESRVEIHLFIPDMSVRPLLRSCHPVLASFEINEALGAKKLEALLLAYLEKSPSVGRSILVQKAFRARVRPKMLQGHLRERFWKTVVEKDAVAERERYRRARGVTENGYDADVEEGSQGSDISEEPDFDPERWSPVDFPYEVYFGENDFGP